MISMWKTRCLKAEENTARVGNDNIEREKELERLRDKLVGAVNDAEGEVRVSRGEAAALRERCIALEEQNEGLIDRYREAEGIIRREGVRFDGMARRVVTETRERDEVGREHIEERHLLNKQWEKREKEIMTSLKREARRVELKEEQVREMAKEIGDLKIRVGGRGRGRGGEEELGEEKWKPTIPSEEASKLKKENSALRKENEKLLLDFLSLQEEASAEDETNKEEKLAAIKLYKSFKRGGAREMATEVRNVVSESGKLLRKIQDYEGRSECGGGGGGFEDSVATR